MRTAIVAVAACLVAVFTPRGTTRSEELLKDRAAMLIYDGRDRVIARLLFADTANLALIVLNQMRGDSVAAAQLANRSCIGIALFSKSEWAAITANGRSPNDARPSEATMRLRVYPATKTARAVVENVLERKAFIAEGLEAMQKPPVFMKRDGTVRALVPNWQSPASAPQQRAESKEEAARSPITWSVQAFLDKAQGPCTVE